MKLTPHCVRLNRRGLLPSRGETKDTFLKRGLLLPNYHNFLSVKWSQVLDMEPDWVELCYNHQGLRFWEAGCTWEGEDRVTIQLQPYFEKKPKYMGYSKEEVIAHESIHALRAPLSSSIFEEILAYQTSESTFRRFWAPFFRSPKESLLFLLLLSFLTMISFIPTLFFVSFAALSLLIALGSLRLLHAQLLFKKATKNLKDVVGDKALALLLRLTDEEIILFSKRNIDIKDYAAKNAPHNLRWEILRDAYFC